MFSDSEQGFKQSIENALSVISSAPWAKLKDLMRPEGAGTLPHCDGCLKRTDRQGYLLPIGKKAKARCLDTSCWDRKLDAYNRGIIEKLRAAGRRILEGKEIGKVGAVYSGDYEGKYRLFGRKGDPELPYELGKKKFKEKCRQCPDLAYYIGDRDRRGYGILIACTRPGCYLVRGRVKKNASKADVAQDRAYEKKLIEETGIVFATAAWALARAEKTPMVGEKDKQALIAQVKIMAEGGSWMCVNANIRHAVNWILDRNGCYRRDEPSYENLKPVKDILEISVNALEIASRALAMFHLVAHNIFKCGHEDKCLIGDPAAIRQMARDIFSPSNEFFLESMVKTGIVAVGRHYQVKGIGGKRGDAIKKIIDARLTSEQPMPKGLEECFGKKQWDKI